MRKKTRRVIYGIVKLTLDKLIALVLLALLAPLFLLVAFLIKWDSPGKALFMQTRVGRFGKLFKIYKFRSMYMTAPLSVATKDLANSKACITRVGRVLRKTSVDELPQLINVLRGDMSLIGPRPLVPEEGEIHQIRTELGAYKVLPGITGLAQVNGRDIISTQSKAETDAWYADNLSAWLDVKIVFYSLLCVVTARGIKEGGASSDDASEIAEASEETPERKRA